MPWRQIEVGDYVRLTPRESPHNDNALWWWRVTDICDYSLDAVYERALVEHRGTEVCAVREGVKLSKRIVKAHRKPDTAEAS